VAVRIVVSLVSAAVLAAVAAGAAGANGAPGPIKVPVTGPGAQPPTTAVLSSAAPGARPVVLTLKLHWEMQCGWPGAGSVSVTLPAAMKMASKLPAGAVRVDGRTARFTRKGRTVTVFLPARKPKVMCNSITTGTLTLELTKAAQLGNPASAGSYTVAARHAGHSYAAAVKVG
jgi:hypothetical protein